MFQIDARSTSTASVIISSVNHNKYVTMYLTDVLMKEHQKLKLTTTTSSAAGATPTVLGRTGDSDQLQPPPDKKLRLLRMLDNDSDEEAAQFGGASYCRRVVWSYAGNNRLPRTYSSHHR